MEQTGRRQTICENQEGEVECTHGNQRPKVVHIFMNLYTYMYHNMLFYFAFCFSSSSNDGPIDGWEMCAE